MRQTLKAQVLEIQAQKVQRVAQMHKMHQTALVTQLEIVTNF